MGPMPINDRLLIKQIMLIGNSNAKFLLKGVNGYIFSNDYNIVSTLYCQALKQTSFEISGPLSSNFLR